MQSNTKTQKTTAKKQTKPKETVTKTSPNLKADLESKLKRAVEAEEYEEAAKLRDELRKLKSEDGDK